MVTPSSFRARPMSARGGFSLLELIMATAIFSVVSAALLMGFISLKRSYAATTDFAINHADQMRISDYLAMDFRRAIKVDPPNRNDVTLYLPCYYEENTFTPRAPTLNGAGGVFYGASDCSIPVRYYLLSSAIYRKEGTKTPAAIAEDVQDFIFDTTDFGKVVKTSVTFKPNYRSAGATAQVTQATAFHNTTLLRNNRGVY